MVSEVTVNIKEDQPWKKIAKKRLQQGISEFRRQFGDQPTRAMQEMLKAEMVAEALNAEVGAYRDRVYPPLTTLGLFIGQALSADGACQDAVARHLSARCARAAGACSLNTGPYCKARQRLPLGLIERLGAALGEQLEKASPWQWKWRGRSVKLMDGTTVSMPDTPANQAAYPQSGLQEAGLGFPVAMIVALISLSTGAALRWAIGPCRGKHTGEQALFRTLMPHLEPGDVVLADRYHCNYFTVALLAERGVDLVTRQHQRRITDFRQGKRLGRRDRLARWERPKCPAWMDAATYARMPEFLILRELEVAGRILVTTLTDARSVSPAQVDVLYGRRWQVEVDLRTIKAELGMDILRGKSPEMVDKEIGVYLLAYNLVCALMTRAAMGTHVPARSLSFKTALQLLLAFQQNLRFAAGCNAHTMTAHLLGAVSHGRLPIRPGRVEPHAVKRRGKNHSFLTVPRQIARDAIIQARTRLALR